MMETDHSTNEDRLEYLYLNLVGQIVQVHTIDGAISEGIFVSRTDADAAAEESGIFVSCCRFLVSEQHSANDDIAFSAETKQFLYKDIVMMVGVNIKLRTETPGMGNIHGYRGDHDLKSLDWAEGGPAELLEGDDNATGPWDQFEANKRFGVQSTYREDIYTTKLDKSKMSPETIEYADRIARDIERSDVRGVQHRVERAEIAGEDVDEALLYSDVSRDKARKGAASAAAPRGKEAKAPAPSKRATEEATPKEAPQGSDFNPNPAAAPFTPSHPIIDDFLREIARAIAGNENCYKCSATWPGDAERVEQYETRPSGQPQQGMPPPPQQHHHHHHHHHQAIGSQHNQQHPHQQQQHHMYMQQQQQQQQQQPPMHHQHAGFGPHHGYARNPGPHMMQQQQQQQQQYVRGTINQGGMHMSHHHQMQGHYMDPNNGGMMNNPGPSGPPPPPRMPPQQQMRPKGSQPQQPVSASNALSGAPPPLPHATAAAMAPSSLPQVESTVEKQAPATMKKLRRGKGDGNEAPQAGRRGGK